MEKYLPQARKDELLVHELGDETLVYDLERHRAHSLNSSAALVWRHCDGRTTTTEMAALLERELNLPADEQVVLFALKRLQRARLLGEKLPPPAEATNPSRRELMRRLGMVGGMVVLIPLVQTIVAPQAAEAQSPECVNTPCPNGQSDCCPGTNCNGPQNGVKTCQPGGP
jgi:hypothetical protein